MAGADGAFGGATQRGGQIINGQSYTPYSPQWYAAMAADKVRVAQEGGTAAGAGVKAAAGAAGIPLGTGTGTTPAVGANGTGSPTIRLGDPGSGMPATSGAPGSSSGSSTPNIPSIAPIDTTAADNAVFNRAKDQVGQTTIGALAGLRSQLGGRGMLGSGSEYKGLESVANKGQQQLGDTTREQAINDVGLAKDTAFQNQNAGVAQRGQDVTAGTSRRGQDIERELGGYQGQITQRGQDINASMSAADRGQAQMASLMALLRSAGTY